MDYVQLTLDDWLEMKARLKQELLAVSKSFVRIGFMLRLVEEEKLYERDGYKSVAEFAQKELGLGASTTSRFIAINKRYSEGGYSDRLLPEYAAYGQSKLTEMLQLPEEDMQMINPQMSREEIRDLARFNKTPQEMPEDIRVFIKGFMATLDNRRAIIEAAEEEAKEMLIPSGSRTYRQGMYFMAMTEAIIKIKKFGRNPEEISWTDFLKIMKEEKGEETTYEAGRETESEGTHSAPERNYPDEECGDHTATEENPDPGRNECESGETVTEDGEGGTVEEEIREEVREEKPSKNLITTSISIAPAQKALLEAAEILKLNLKERNWKAALRRLDQIRTEIEQVQKREAEADPNQMELTTFPGIMPEPTT